MSCFTSTPFQMCCALKLLGVIVCIIISCKEGSDQSHGIEWECAGLCILQVGEYSLSWWDDPLSIHLRCATHVTYPLHLLPCMTSHPFAFGFHPCPSVHQGQYVCQRRAKIPNYDAWNTAHLLCLYHCITRFTLSLICHY